MVVKRYCHERVIHPQGVGQWGRAGRTRLAGAFAEESEDEDDFFNMTGIKKAMEKAQVKTLYLQNTAAVQRLD